MLHRRTFFQGRSIHGQQMSDIEWYRPDGAEISKDEWNSGFVRCLGLLLNDAIMEEWDARGKHVQDDIVFTLPGLADATSWELLADTTNPAAEAQSLRPGTAFDLQGRSLAVLRQRIGPASDVTA